MNNKYIYIGNDLIAPIGDDVTKHHYMADEELASLPKIEVNGTHSWEINQILVEDVDFKFMKRPDSINLKTRERTKKPIRAYSIEYLDKLHKENMEYFKNNPIMVMEISSDGIKPVEKAPISKPNTDVKQNLVASNSADGIRQDRYRIVVEEIYKEVRRAKTLFPIDFHNQHEGYAVILEEIDELWDEVKKNQKVYDLKAQRKEVVQCAAMCVRFAAELLNKEQGAQASVATGDAILMNDDNKINPVKEGERLYSKEDMEKAALVVFMSKKYTPPFDLNNSVYKKIFKRFVDDLQMAFEYLSSPEFKNNQK